MLRTTAALAVLALLAPRSAAAQSCDRACLTGIVGAYLAAMTAHDPSKAPVAARVTTYRVVAVDKEMGAVLLWQNFGPGALPGAANSSNTFITFEAFKVYGGRIQAAEAILETLPIGAPSGWGK